MKANCTSSLIVASAVSLTLVIVNESEAALVHHYEFNTGSELVDSVGSNDLVSTVEGAGGAVSFAGGIATHSGGTANNGEQLQPTNAIGLGSADDWTLAFFVKDVDSSDDVNFSGAVSNNDADGNGGPFTWQLDYRNAAAGDFGGPNGLGTIGSLSDGGFHHVALVHDSGSASGPVAYLDGANTGLSFDAVRDVIDVLQLFRNRNDTTTQYFNGSLADVRIYDNALTDNEVAGLAANVPIPEPASIVLLGGATLVIAGAWCRK